MTCLSAYLRTTHSVTVLEDFSRLKASWYLRLSTSFFIWGRSISSMAAARCRASLPERGERGGQSCIYRDIFIRHTAYWYMVGTHSIQLCPAAKRKPQSRFPPTGRENRSCKIHKCWRNWQTHLTPQDIFSSFTFFFFYSHLGRVFPLECAIFNYSITFATNRTEVQEEIYFTQTLAHFFGISSLMVSYKD